MEISRVVGILLGHSVPLFECEPSMECEEGLGTLGVGDGNENLIIPVALPGVTRQ